MAGITTTTYIIIIFIIFIIISKSRKQKDNTISEAKKAQLLNEYYKKAAAKGNYPQQTGTAAGAYPNTLQRGGTYQAAGSAMSSNNVVAGKANMPSNSAAHTAPQSEGKSTTDYLTEKARRDQIEHAKEKMEENRNIQKKYGGRPVGGRYLLGDPVPHGMRLVICEYCGAENIVEAGFHSDKDCYFCRTKLPH